MNELQRQYLEETKHVLTTTIQNTQPNEWLLRMFLQFQLTLLNDLQTNLNKLEEDQ